MSAVDLFVVLCAAVALYGIVRWNQAEKTHYNKLVDSVMELRAELVTERRASENLRLDIRSLESKVKSLENEVQAAQDHMGKQRKSLLRMKDALIKKSVRVQHVGAIPVEVVPGTKRGTPIEKPSKQIRQIKKQLDELSK